MDVSIVIPTFNEAEATALAIEKAWLAGASQVIVVDGGSTDGTLEVAKRLRCEFIQTAPGRALQQNAGAAIARGEVLLFLHADNWLEGDSTAQILKSLCDKEVLGGAFRQKIDALGILYRLLEWGNALRVSLRGIPYGDQGIFMRRHVFEELGGFPEVPLMEDLLLMKKLRRRRWPVLLAGPLHVDARRWHRNGVVRQTLRNWALLLAHSCGVSTDRLARFYPRHNG